MTIRSISEELLDLKLLDSSSPNRKGEETGGSSVRKAKLEEGQKMQIMKDGLVEKAVESNRKYIMTETLTAELEIEDQLDNGTTVIFDEVNTKLLIQKH